MTADSQASRIYELVLAVVLVALSVVVVAALWMLDPGALWLSVRVGVLANLLGILAGVFVTFGLGIPRDGTLPWNPNEVLCQEEEDSTPPNAVDTRFEPFDGPQVTEASDRFVTAATYLEPNIAHIARVRLESDGIRAALDREHHISMDWIISNAVGGVKLLVRECDQELATRVLKETGGEIDPAEAGDDSPDSPLLPCPRCGSLETYHERLNRKLTLGSVLLLGIPIPFVRRHMSCSRCSFRWKPSE